MNYKIIKLTLDSLKKAYESNLLGKGNYVFIVSDRHESICISTSAEDFDIILPKVCAIVNFFEDLGLTTLFLIRPKAAPENGVRQDEVITCMAFKENHLAAVMARGLASNLRLLCFHVAIVEVTQNTNGRILARTFDDLSLPKSEMDKSNRFTVAIPHQGELGFLDSCLRNISASARPPKHTWVYFDEELTTEHFELTKKYRYPSYRKVEPSNCGPYIPRNHCVEYSNTEYICFQDSDDLPTYERFSEIYRYVYENPEINMAGCHELRIDEIEEKVLAVRFPINVTQALKITASHPLFHPTAFAKSADMKNAGLFSTVRRYGADSQFLLRAYFSMEIRNIDKFLYIRRKRPGSLTTSPSTMLGSDDRTKLDVMWKSDFELVKRGSLSLGCSSLREEHLPFDVSLVEIQA